MYSYFTNMDWVIHMTKSGGNEQFVQYKVVTKPDVYEEKSLVFAASKKYVYQRQSFP